MRQAVKIRTGLVGRAGGPSLRLAGFLIGLALVAAACGRDDSDGSSSDDEASASTDPAGGSADLPSEPFELTDGTTATLADIHDGKPLVVNFFASWCGPCRAEMPDFQAVYADVGDDVDFFGLALSDTAGAAADLVEDTGVGYRWGLTDGQVFAALGGREMPTTVYVSADGKVLARDDGSISESGLRSRVEDLFGVPS